METGQLPTGLLPSAVEQLTMLPADGVVVLSSGISDQSGNTVLGRLGDHMGEQLMDTVQYIDLSKAHLASGLGPPAAVADTTEGRVSLHDEYPRWQAIKRRLNLTEDHELARVLLDLYETNVDCGRLAKMEEERDNEFGDNDNTMTVVHCEINDTTRTPGGGGGGDCILGYPAVVGERVKRGAGRVPRTGSRSVQAASVRAERSSTYKTSARSNRPCPRSRKPPGWRQEPASVPPPEPASAPPPEPDDLEDSGSEGGGPPEEAVEPASKLFTFPPVEPELLRYFSCGLCDERDFNDVETYFDHLWREHTEFHMVGGRIQRVPIRLRPQLFVICALCGLNNKGSNGDCHTYLTQHHMPVHAAVVLARWPALRCDGCWSEFPERGALALHAIDEQHENAPHRCPACVTEVEGTANYIAHLQQHYLSRPYQCYFCMEMFASESGCIAHIKRHHAADYSVHKCSGCGYVTALFHDFLLHIRSHSHLNRHVCHVCGVMFVSKMSLKHHIRTHSDSQFPCEQCGKVFSHPQTRRRHVLNAHHRPEKCTCSVCGRQFGTAYSMRRHYMIHTGERPFQCDKCGKGFVQKGDLQSHYKRCKVAEISTTSVFVSM